MDRRDMRGTYSDERTRAQAAAMTEEDLDPAEPQTPEEAARSLKWQRAMRASGIDRLDDWYVTTNVMWRALGRNGMRDVWDSMTWEQQAAVLVACQACREYERDGLPEGY